MLDHHCVCRREARQLLTVSSAYCEPMISCVLALCRAADKADGLARPGPILDNIEGPVMPSLTPLSLNTSALHPMRCLHFSVSRLSVIVQHTVLDLQAGLDITMKNNHGDCDRLALCFKEIAVADG